MDELVELLLDETREKMNKSIHHLGNGLIKIRAGKANPNILNGIMIDYYGVQTPLNQISNIGTPDPRTIAIQPWEKPYINAIEKAILQANLGLNPDNNGEIIRINIPPLTEERRKELVKQVRNEGENTKVGIRNTRREANEELKNMKKDGLAEDDEKKAVEEVQKMTDEFIDKIDKILETKETDIMTV
ncbi:MAG: ribosome recycling factor [Bacteroidales bacterium]|nr:ribosome recycling factor [Bacteroidales bacterium]